LPEAGEECIVIDSRLENPPRRSVGHSRAGAVLTVVALSVTLASSGPSGAGQHRDSPGGDCPPPLLSCAAILIEDSEDEGCGLVEVQFSALPRCGIALVSGSIDIGCTSIFVSNAEIIELCCEHHEDERDDDRPGVCLSDLDGDGFINGADLGVLLLAWGTADPLADLSADGLVDGADLGILLKHFGACGDDLCAFSDDGMLIIVSTQALLEVNAYDGQGRLLGSCDFDLCELVHR
jgi:hypothetical protein